MKQRISHNRRLLLICILFGCAAIFIRSVLTIVWTDTETRSINYKELDFAWQKTPIEGRYRLNIEKIDREIAVSLLNPDQLIMIYKRAPRIFPLIEQQLRELGLPDDLKYIAVTESALRNSSISTAGAAGIRQLMPGTAQWLGLKVDSYVDERYNIPKATDAALRYLKQLWETFHDRPLVLAAYNRGSNWLLQDMDDQKSSNYFDLRLYDETARYRYRAITLKYILEHIDLYMDKELLGNQYEPVSYDTVLVKWPLDLLSRSKSRGISFGLLREWNPWILKTSLPKGERTLFLLK